MTLITPAGRIGILGGTFDPIHLGHTDTALAARDALQLESVVLMPANVPPHREHGPAASTFHRFAMAALAANGLPNVSVSDDELRADGPSYTALTLERLAARGIAATSIFFITGADAFAEIETWYRYPGVLDLAHFVVVSRPGLPATAISERFPAIRDRFRDPSARGHAQTRTSVFLVDQPTADVSSTSVRQRLRSGQTITGFVPPAVEAHIIRHHLYTQGVTAVHVK